MVFSIRSSPNRVAARSEIEAGLSIEDSGVCLGWLLDSKDQQIEICRLGKATETYALPITLSGEGYFARIYVAIKRSLQI